MLSKSSLLILPVVLLSIFSIHADAQRRGNRDPGQATAGKGASTDPVESAVSLLRPRNIGPAFTSGRIVSFAVDPHNRSSYYAAAASGGVWKTTNNGSTWTPVFEHEASYSIGVVTLDPNNVNTVWVGTGENNAQRSVGYGDGVYKSIDGGKSWRNVGLKTSEHIGKIVVDPRDSNIVFVAAQGPLWSAGGERGLYRTLDGGKTWVNVLKISENTGVTDVEIDLKNPDVLYAASYQRRRHVWTLIDGGPESAIYKSTDGGDTWTKLRSGLPGGDLGRIGIAVSPVDSSVIWATVEASGKSGGVFRSSDYGASWERRNEFVSSGMYYGQIIADPKDLERVYVLGVVNQVSDDGGRTVRALGERGKHVDNHALWIDPHDTNYILAGCDGGVYDSYDKGATWQFKSNLPIAQFYDVAVDNNAPYYYVYGGTQDNSSVGGPSRTRNGAGIVSSDWIVTAGGDGFHQQVDPTNADIVYSESQYGGLVRFNRKNGERLSIQPIPSAGEPPIRWNWDSPFIVSPFSPKRLYFAANRLYKSDDQGNTWVPVSGDLSRQLDRNSLRVMDRIWNSDAIAKHQSTSFYGNVTALAESPKLEGLLFVGTDDGLIQISPDGGKTWQQQEKFTGIPDKTYVSHIVPSQYSADVVYATFENHKMGDFAPYVLKSVDRGKTWTSLAANLPTNGSVLAFAEDHIQSTLLFVGTEFGMYTSVNGGNKWVKVGGLPTI
ncbi:MAG: glycosyl hydrolase, partial [Chthonomonadales bacterium]